MQFLVPQFIETEDKIVGPLTIRQFGWIAIAAVICFALFFIVNFTIWIIFAVVIGGTGFAFAFIKINGRPMSIVARAAWNYFWQPQQYVWQPEHAVKTAARTPAKEGLSVEKVVASMALKTAWRVTATGSKEPDTSSASTKSQSEQYQIFRGLTGEKRAARRIDYR
jgi:hypothetical protein